MPSLQTESILRYNVGKFGAAGYAVPNWSDNIASMNITILNMVDTIGRNLFAFLHHDDADQRTPPSINTIERINKLCLRIRQILASRAIAPGTLNMENVHAEPAPDIFKVYPAPYFSCRNSFLKMYAGLIFTCLSELMQSTENRNPIEISTTLSSLVGQYFQRIYTMMATELLAVPAAIAQAPGYTIDTPTLAAYNPSNYFTSTELVDTCARFDQVFTAQSLEILGNGIPVT